VLANPQRRLANGSHGRPFLHGGQRLDASRKIRKLPRPHQHLASISYRVGPRARTGCAG